MMAPIATADFKPRIVELFMAQALMFPMQLRKNWISASSYDKQIPVIPIGVMKQQNI